MCLWVREFRHRRGWGKGRLLRGSRQLWWQWRLGQGGALATMYGSHDLYVVNCTFAANGAYGGVGGRGAMPPAELGRRRRRRWGRPRAVPSTSFRVVVDVLDQAHYDQHERVPFGWRGTWWLGPAGRRPGCRRDRRRLGLYFNGTGNPGDTLPWITPSSRPTWPPRHRAAPLFISTARMSGA